MIINRYSVQLTTNLTWYYYHTNPYITKTSDTFLVLLWYSK